MNAAEELGSSNWLLFWKWYKPGCVWVLAILEEEFWICRGTWELDQGGCSSPSEVYLSSLIHGSTGSHLSGLWLELILKLWKSKQLERRPLTSNIFSADLLGKLWWERGIIGNFVSMVSLVGLAWDDPLERTEFTWRWVLFLSSWVWHIPGSGAWPGGGKGLLWETPSGCCCPSLAP